MRVLRMRYLLAALVLGLLAPGFGSAGSVSVAADSIRGKVRVVPNPWCANDSSQHYAKATGRPYDDTSGGYSRVLFFNLPSKATIRIYTVDGDLIRTIEHPLPGGGATRWDLLSNSGQYAASGIYVFVVESDIGTDMGKIIIIR